MFRSKMLLSTFIIYTSTLCSSHAAYAKNDPFARDLIILTNWFEGEFDNEEQIWFENYPEQLKQGEEKHPRIHTMHRRINVPEIGDHVFYVEEYVANDPAQIVKQEIVTFRSDPEAGGIRMQVGRLRNAKNAQGGYHFPDRLNLKKSDISFASNTNCDVLWRRDAAQFEGRIRDKKCQVDEKGKPQYSAYQSKLSENAYWRNEQKRLVSDNSLSFGFPDDRPYTLNRALPFTCNGRFFSDPAATFDSGKSPIQHFSNQRIHSQGGTFEVKRDNDGETFEILMRSKEYPFYTERPNFIYFSVRKAGEERSIVFSVHDALSRYVGVTLPGMSLYCYRVGYEFDEPLDTLDQAAP